MERSKEFFAFCMILMLMIPAAAMAGAVPDTGQTLCYDDQGVEIKPCPAKCTNDICERKFTVKVGTVTYSSFFAGTTDPKKQVFAFGKRRCFDEKGSEIKCVACECYDKATLGTKIDCPTGNNCFDKATLGTAIPCPTYSYVYTPGAVADLATLKEKRGSASDDFYGQDGNYTVNASSYTKLNSGGKEVSSTSTTWSMIKDNITGLTWAVKQSKDNSADVTNPHDGDNTYTWDKVSTDFLSKLNDSPGFGGVTDWKLPTIQQLDSLVNAATATASIDTASFPSMGAEYWSSTADAVSGKAWYINFGKGGMIASDDKTKSYHVIAVRGL
ncbi:MAG: hypothetical protein BWK80_60495 [Desulfobacteraceae bacterium IS3]|nr:MAG: hypothetical protein BWK80_60495 [Desulfobacteraceae bacterium IS3]